MMIYYGRKDKKSHEKRNTKYITPKKTSGFSAVKMEILMYAHFATLSQEIASFQFFSCNQHSISLDRALHKMYQGPYQYGLTINIGR